VSAIDVGCGVGLTDRYLDGFCSLVGVDISPGVLEEAAKANCGVRYLEYDGKRLPFENESFDLAFTICVVHHVPVAEWASFVAEIARCVRPGGLVVIFEHNPFNPLTRLAVRRCAFDEDATLLRRSKAAHLLRQAGLDTVESAYILFFPWPARALNALDQRLGRFPLGSQYYVSGRKRAR
jgi:SAM-dependent methyltransferase